MAYNSLRSFWLIFRVPPQGSTVELQKQPAVAILCGSYTPPHLLLSFQPTISLTKCHKKTQPTNLISEKSHQIHLTQLISASKPLLPPPKVPHGSSPASPSARLHSGVPQGLSMPGGCLQRRRCASCFSC